MVSVEDLTEEELSVIGQYYSKLSEMAQSEKDIRATHSIDEARGMHDAKYKSTNKHDKSLS